MADKSGGKKLFERFRQTGSSSGGGGHSSSVQKVEYETKESLSAENFTAANICRRGFPHEPTCSAFDPIQKLLAVGARRGTIRIFGKHGVDFYLKHDTNASVTKLQFLINEGAFISLCDDNCIHLWSIRQKEPAIVHSLQFQPKEKVTTMHLPFQSKWLYLGTAKGNVRIVSVETFQLSGYDIQWNKAIDLSQKNHPGEVVDISDCPGDDSKILIGFQMGNMVLWNLKQRQAEARFNCDQMLSCVAWHFEGKQFISAHGDGSLITWSIKKPQEPLLVTFPHSVVSENKNHTRAAPPEPNNKPVTKQKFQSIDRVEWKHQKNGDDFIVFSGGSLIANDFIDCDPVCLTIIRNKSVSVIEMEHRIVTFDVLVELPYCQEAQEPYAVSVLLDNDLVIVDLFSRGYPCFENPYPMDLNESTVTCCCYLADCPADLVPAFCLVGSKQKRQGYSEKSWPVKGGECGINSLSYSELLITGHVDGSLKFWDSSCLNVQVLYKVKTSKYFEKSSDSEKHTDIDLFAARHIQFCPESRLLLVSFDGGQVVLLRFSKRDITSEIATLIVPLPFGRSNRSDNDQSDLETPSTGRAATIDNSKTLGLKRQRSAGCLATGSSLSLDNLDLSCTYQPLKTKNGQQKFSAGYFPDLVCFVPWSNTQTAPSITSLALNSSYGLLAFGTDKHVTVVDFNRRICLFNKLTQDLYAGTNAIDSAGNKVLKKNASSDSESYNSPGEKPDISQRQISVTESILSPDFNVAEFFPTCHSSTTKIPTPHDPSSSFYLHPISSYEDDETFLGIPPPLTSTVSDITASELKKKEALDDEKRRQRASSAKMVRSPNMMRAKQLREVLIRRQESAPNVLKVEPLENNDRPVPPARKKRAARRELSDSQTRHSHVNICSSPDLTKVNQSGCSSPTAVVKHLDRKNSLISSIFSRHNPNETVDHGATEQSAASQRQARHGSKGSIDMTALRNFARRISHKRNRKDSGLERENSKSSCSSQENISNVNAPPDGVRCLAFIESYIKKSDYYGPCLWIGTTQGVLCSLSIKIPTEDSRSDQEIAVSNTGVHFRPKGGSVLCVGFLDHRGNLLLPPTDSFKDSVKGVGKPIRNNRVIMKNNRICSAPTLYDGGNEENNVAGKETNSKQWLVVCCEKQIEVFMLTTVQKQFVQRFDLPLQNAQILTLDGAPFVVGYFSTGRTVVYSLPSLRLLMDTNFLPADDIRLNKTIQFSQRGHGMYMCSASEIQKFTLSSEAANFMNDLRGSLFQPCNLPEPPKTTFFKGILSSVIDGKALDRDDLFGQSSGKASNSIARLIPTNLDPIHADAGNTTNVVLAAKMALHERGDKLSAVEEQTELLKISSMSAASKANELMQLYKNKRWYQ